MKRQIAVIGLGRFGSAIAGALHDLGHEVLAIDRDQAKVDAWADVASHVAQADGGDRAAMEELGIRDVDVGIVAMSGELASSILTTLTLEEMGVPYIIAKAADDVHATILTKIGADRVVLAERETAVRLSHTFMLRNAQDYMALVADYGIAKIQASDSLIGRSIQELDLRGRYGLSLLALCRESTILMYPRGEDKILAGDSLVVAGRDERIEQLSK